MNIHEAHAWLTLDMLGFSGKHRANILKWGACNFVEQLKCPSRPFIESVSIFKKASKDAQKMFWAPNKVAEVFKKAKAHYLLLTNNGLWLWNDLKDAGLHEVPSPPLVLYGMGNAELLGPHHRKISVVGSRHPTSLGMHRTREWVACWANAQKVIVSGAARGIDTAAHTAGLASKGQTIAVLGDGLKVDLRFKRIKWFESAGHEDVCVISEYSPWRQANRGTFVARNRIVAGLSEATVLMEGHARSGALHTLKYSKKMGKLTFAIPGAPENAMSHAAALSFKMSLAQPALSPTQILEEIPAKFKNMNLPLDSPVQVTINAPISSARPPVEEGHEKTVLSFVSRLQETGICFDVLLCETQLGVADLQISLSQLKMNGWVRQKGALYYPA